MTGGDQQSRRLRDTRPVPTCICFYLSLNYSDLKESPGSQSGNEVFLLCPARGGYKAKVRVHLTEKSRHVAVGSEEELTEVRR